jgi:hypothetical protein
MEGPIVESSMVQPQEFVRVLDAAKEERSLTKLLATLPRDYSPYVWALIRRGDLVVTRQDGSLMVRLFKEN